MTNKTQEIQEILSLLDDNALLTLASTVTQGLLKNKVETRQEAIEAIINYSPDDVSVLKRKSVTREILFSYLHRKNVTLNGNFTKNELIDKIVDNWSQSEPVKPVSEAVSLLAEKFSQWFYDIINESKPIPQEHFFSDAKLALAMTSDGQITTELVENDPDRISQQLFQVKMQHNLYFNPNLTQDGVQGRMDPHGLVLVLSCGTLHSNNVCVGVFEQVFSLARDPFSGNNWKIKNTELRLKSKNVVHTPCLCDSDLTRNLLALPS